MVRNLLETAAALAAVREKGQGRIEAWRTRESEQEEEDAERSAERIGVWFGGVAELATGVPYMRDEDRLEIQNLSCDAFSA
jgi:hypothetical protein